MKAALGHVPVQGDATFVQVITMSVCCMAFLPLPLSYFDLALASFPGISVIRRGNHAGQCLQT